LIAIRGYERDTSFGNQCTSTATVSEVITGVTVPGSPWRDCNTIRTEITVSESFNIRGLDATGILLIQGEPTGAADEGSRGAQTGESSRGEQTSEANEGIGGQPSNEDDEALSRPALIAICVIVPLVAVAIGMGIYLYIRWRKRKTQQPKAMGDLVDHTSLNQPTTNAELDSSTRAAHLWTHPELHADNSVVAHGPGNGPSEFRGHVAISAAELNPDAVPTRWHELSPDATPTRWHELSPDAAPTRWHELQDTNELKGSPNR
jgi:hypothetical protein